jgi:hypothetical protein
MSQSLYAAIPIVMNRFNFEQVHKVMTFLNWKWATTSVGYAVPTLNDLMNEAHRQLTMAVDEYYRRDQPPSGMNISSGGFQANVVTFEKGTPQLQLLFYVDESSQGV